MTLKILLSDILAFPVYHAAIGKIGVLVTRQADQQSIIEKKDMIKGKDENLIQRVKNNRI